MTERAIAYFEKELGRGPEVVASAPGRLDFLNTHQDYKGLPVVSIAINKRTYVAASRSRSRSRVISINLRDEGLPYIDEFDASSPKLAKGGWFGNYIRSAVIALRDAGVGVDEFNMLIYSEIPMSSGLASSAALQVATIKALAELSGVDISSREVAELAYRSEHDIMGIPCGRLDQYGSALGGITYIETRPPFSTKTYELCGLALVAMNSGVKHSTGAIHPKRIAELGDGLRELLELPELPKNIRDLLSEDVYATKWELLELSDLEPYLQRVNQVSRKRITFTLKMQKSTILALELLREPGKRALEQIEEFLEAECPLCVEASSRARDPVLRGMGGIVNYQHVLLRDLYDVSAPELEAIRERALASGALGVKISGAGLGGAMLAIVEDKVAGEEVVKRVGDILAGAWLVEVDRGVVVEKAA